jgi:hypothetical protein
VVEPIINHPQNHQKWAGLTQMVWKVPRVVTRVVANGFPPLMNGTFGDAPPALHT